MFNIYEHENKKFYFVLALSVMFRHLRFNYQHGSYFGILENTSLSDFKLICFISPFSHAFTELLTAM